MEDERSSTEVAAVSVLVAESEPARLRDLLEVVGEARVFVIGVRTFDAIVRVLDREHVDLVVVADDFDHGRALQVATAAASRCPCVLLTRPGAEPSPSANGAFVRFVTRPVTREKVEEIVGRRQAQ